MKLPIKISALIIALLVPAISLAVTKEDMEKARAVTALWYLRYANNGSDYLEKLNPKTISELEESLKAKEKENIKTFNSLAAFPPDYQNWDKSELVKYWSETFFASSSVPAEAKKARPRVAKILGGMEFSGPVQAEPTPEPAADTTSTPTPDEAALAAAEEAAIDSAAADPLDETTPEESSDSTTWIYIGILIVAIAVVVGLVVYAMNAMKGRDKEDNNKEAENNAELEELRNRLAQTVAQKNAEIAELEARLQETERRLAEAERNASAGSTRFRGREVSPRQSREVYLARANNSGVFVRADSTYNVGNSIFRLVTTDGLTGTFSVIDDPSVYEVALMMPADYLLNACSGRNLQLSAGMRGIVTDTPGTAVFEGGRWRVTRKATIHYTR